MFIPKVDENGQLIVIIFIIAYSLYRHKAIMEYK